MQVIGLTGGIASGKSTVAKMLEEKGAYLLDADRLAREVVEPDQPAWQEIVNWLGQLILLPDRSIDRSKLAELVFSNRPMLERLNSIVHPRVGFRLVDLSKIIGEKDPDAVLIYDIPLLIEHCSKIYGNDKKIPVNILDALINYDWPGNVRELQNTVHRYFTFNKLDVLDLPISPIDENKQSDKELEKFLESPDDLRTIISKIEKKLIENALKRFRWHKGKVCSTLGIDRKTLNSKISLYNLD